MKLPARQKQLYDLLFGRGDVPIIDLYAALTERSDNAMVMAEMQRRVTPYIVNLNRNLVEHQLHVEPGALKNTYRLVAVT